MRGDERAGDPPTSASATGYPRQAARASRVLRSWRVPRVALFAAVLVLRAGAAHAEDAGAAGMDPDAGLPAAQGSCVETVPQGSRRPTLEEAFPTRGLSGYAATLRVTVEHGKGETVLPRGLDLQSESAAAKELRAAGFVIPDQDGSAGAHLDTSAPAKQGDRASTVVELPLVALPGDPGRHTLTLPPLPVAVARSSGEVMTLCTRPHVIVVEDPIASALDPRPLPNPPGRVQREEWTALKRALAWVAAGALLGALLAYAVYRWSKRPKRLPPPPPPRPAWEVALEQLDEVRHAGLLEVGRQAEYFDRVSDTLRRYLGARYGFDGLESTTDEVLRALQHAQLHGVSLPELAVFLRDCDLVKFANSQPTPEDCARILHGGEHIVRATMPRAAAFAEGRGP